MTSETETKKYPKYTGKVQTPDRNNTSAGKISLWDNLDPTSEKSPLMTGHVEIITGNVTTKYRISLWKYVPRE